MDIADHLRAIWRRRWIVLGVAVLVTAVVVALSQKGSETYEARARLGLRLPGSASLDGGRPENLIFLARTYVARAETGPVLQAAAERAGLDLGPQQVNNRTAVGVSTADATLVVTATCPTGADAAALATGMAEALAAHIDDLEQAARAERLAPIDGQLAATQRLISGAAPGSLEYEASVREYSVLRSTRSQVELAPAGGLELLRPASIPGGPVSPKPVRDGILAFLVAFVVAAEIAALQQLYEQRWGALGALR